ncbi:MAG: hypothetical protein KAU48_15045 [Candidatus Thorarchaeota archaeon]|nr:hypothetical protein [Candidatus Thorarchaeota archaeon]
MSWKEHIRDIAELQTETPTPRLFEVVRYMIDKPIAIPLRVLEDSLGDRIESAWNAILGSLSVDAVMGTESEWKHVNWVAHTDEESIPYISFARIDMGE